MELSDKVKLGLVGLGFLAIEFEYLGMDPTIDRFFRTATPFSTAATFQAVVEAAPVPCIIKENGLLFSYVGMTAYSLSQSHNVWDVLMSLSFGAVGYILSKGIKEAQEKQI